MYLARGVLRVRVVKSPTVAQEDARRGFAVDKAAKGRGAGASFQLHSQWAHHQPAGTGHPAAVRHQQEMVQDSQR